MNGESAGPALLTKRFLATDIPGDHITAVKAQAKVTLEFFIGLLLVSSKQNGLATESLLRSVFESGVNTVILAKHPEKLKDFMCHGQFTHLRMARFATSQFTPTMTKHIEAFLAATEADWKLLSPEFKDTEWHRMKKRDSFKDAELSDEMYDKYFRPASAYAHAGPYIVVRPADNEGRTWEIDATGKRWVLRALSGYIMGCYAMTRMLVILSREFKLDYEKELVEITAEIDKYKEQHINAIKQGFEDYYDKAGQAVQSSNQEEGQGLPEVH
jgi:hypothetical protein